MNSKEQNNAFIFFYPHQTLCLCVLRDLCGRKFFKISGEKMKIKRKIIQIEEDKCDGCGLCVPSCAEGALQIIDGKARVVADKFCDGLGACLGECPNDALHVIERVA
jgi:Pyruvate/2-oxoacid:ferredoxin oxidoreductase delta subunit